MEHLAHVQIAFETISNIYIYIQDVPELKVHNLHTNSL